MSRQLLLSSLLFFFLQLRGANSYDSCSHSHATTTRPSPPHSPVQVHLHRRSWIGRAAAAAVAAAVTTVATTPGSAEASVGAILQAASDNSMITYSSNAKNFARLGEGDQSAGSKYQNDNFKTPAAAKRRALTGCKFEVARSKASSLSNSGGLSEKDCNQRVIGGDYEFMLSTLRELDCPSCAYGIREK
jgi:hypothetical protein